MSQGMQLSLPPHAWQAIRKSHMILLEILIALALVAFCALPLVYPQVYILKSERKFIDTVELDHFVNLLFANRLQKLYLNEIPWSTIESGRPQHIDENILNEMEYKEGLPFDGTYQFSIIKRKPREPAERTLFLVKLLFAFTPKKSKEVDKEAKYVYEYEIFIERQQKQADGGVS